MNSTSIKIKKFFSNRNTVAIICLILGIIVLYVGYTLKVNSATNPVTVPYAKTTIQPRTKITDDMIGTVDVASAAVDGLGDIITDTDKLIDYYSNINTMIPEGSFFYSQAVVAEDELPDAAVYDLAEGENLYYLTVNMATSYVNSIVPGGYIDIYITTTDSTTGLVRTGKFIQNIEVLAVKTSDGLNVFENSEETRTPAYVLFAVDDDQFYYLSAAAQLNLKITPVPTNAKTYLDEEDLSSSNITSDDLKEYIDNLSEEFLQSTSYTTSESDTSNQETTTSGE